MVLVRVIELMRRALATRAARFALVLIVGVLGAGAGIAMAGKVDVSVGPADVTMWLRPSFSGDTVIDIAPLGNLELDTHDSPVQLHAALQQIRSEDARALIGDPRALDRLPDQVGADVRDGVFSLARKAVLAGIVGAFLLGLLFFRRLRTAGYTALAGALAVLLTYGLAALTFNPRSIAEPRYNGLLASAPSVVGSAENIVERFSAYRGQLAKLVTNVSRLYETTSRLPVFETEPSTIPVLHVSDIHLNPAAWNVIRSIAGQFQVAAIVDTGDLTDHGSAAERQFVTEISRLEVPYIFIRGNHDSPTIARAVARQKGGIVLEDDVREVAGLRFYGIGDPRFTPDKTTRDDARTAADMRVQGARLAPRVAAAKADVVLIHDPDEARGMPGVAPLIVSGHGHRRATELLDGGTRLFVQGSTGGAGLRGLEHEEPTPIQCSVLYFDRETKRLRAWDDITVGGLGESSAEIIRRLEPEPDRMISPSPVPSVSAGSATPETSTATATPP